MVKPPKEDIVGVLDEFQYSFWSLDENIKDEYLGL
jgi:hypothetical protein